MARVKRRCQKWRPRTKSSSKEKKHTEFPSSSILPSKAFRPKSPVTLRSQRRPFCSRFLALEDILETLKHVLAAAVSWCWWCQRHVAHIFRIFVNAAFLSHTYREELKTLGAEVKNLEREVAKLRSILQQNERTAASAGSPPCQLSPNLLSASPAHTQLSVTQPTPLSSQKLEIPPPPPLPPPLPPPPPPVSLGFKRRSDPKPVPLKKDIPLQITPQDLLNVKLKKTKSEPAVDKKMSPFQGGKAVISLQVLQSVRLQSKPPQPLPRLTNLLNTPSKDGLDFRKHLKKVAIERSPGGTPMNNKENIETGTGLTPLMTQALRRKFQARLSRNVYWCPCLSSFPGKIGPVESRKTSFWLTQRVPLLHAFLQETVSRNRTNISWWSPQMSTMDTSRCLGEQYGRRKEGFAWQSFSHAGTCLFFPSLQFFKKIFCNNTLPKKTL
ncbi:LOW QUALITY PROTEIN: proline-rich protein 11 [Vipera latastei]